ncbi:MAG: hypothetical protein K6F95_07570 [Selenomonas sp.]|uniref:hypothetical protein n=1 Tax=Selenomonas sp. TaxID=2053611 RepID=UPI002600C6D2|nr:hypothetical protein [Selenomonas sp.]MCR5757750.1 hypothetical protein [Selenomonas sp.]
MVDTLPAIKNYKMGYDTLRRFNYDKSKIKLVENCASREKVVPSRNVERILDEPFCSQLPYDEGAVQASIQQKCPAVLLPGNYPLKRGFLQLAKLYSQDGTKKVPQEKQEPGFFQRLYHQWG